MQITVQRVEIYDGHQRANEEHLVWMSGVEPIPRLSYELQRRPRMFRDDVLHFEESGNVAPQTLEILFPLLRLHCPNSPGSRAKESTTKAITSGLGMKFALPAITGASNFDVEFSVDSTWETEDGRCIEVVVPVIVRFALGQYFLNERPFALGFNLHVEEVRPHLVIQRPIPEPEDQCQRVTTANHRFRQVSPVTRVLGGVNTVSITTKSKVSGMRNIGAEIFGGRVNLAVSYERTSTVEYVTEYSLAPGYEYEALAEFSPDADWSPEVVWRTTPIA